MDIQQTIAWNKCQAQLLDYQRQFEDTMAKMFTEHIRLMDRDENEFEIQADQVVIAMAGKPDNHLINDLKKTDIPFSVVGDASEPGNLGSALRSGTKAALSI